jgi:hypothetical protein
VSAANKVLTTLQTPFKRKVTLRLTSVAGAGSPNTKFWEGIENEHTKMAGFDTSFTTNNYGVTTTPLKEYNIATGKQVCPEEDMLDRKKRKVRVIHKIDALKTLKICEKAGLADYEVLAVVSLS